MWQLCHSYLAPPLHDIYTEPLCIRPFSFDFEQPFFTEEDTKELIWIESVICDIMIFNPDLPIYLDFALLLYVHSEILFDWFTTVLGSCQFCTEVLTFLIY